MRILTSLVQEKISDYVKEFEKLENILNEIRKEVNKDTPNNFKRSKSPMNKNIELENLNEINKKMKEEYLQTVVNKLFKNKQVINESISVLKKILKKIYEKSFFELLKNKLKLQNIITLFEIIEKIYIRIIMRYKRLLFFFLLNLNIKFIGCEKLKRYR